MALLEQKLGGRLSLMIADFRKGRRTGWLKRSLLMVRSLLVHQLDQKKVSQEDVDRVSGCFKVNREHYRNMRRTIRRGFERGLFTNDDYKAARMILGSREQQYNAQPIAEKVTIEALSSLVLMDQKERLGK